MNAKRKSLRICSLFTGCGGLDLGMMGGFDFLGVRYPKNRMRMVWAADNDLNSYLTLRANPKYFGRNITGHFYSKDLKDFSEYESIPDFDILTAGFPCQPFSNAGDRGGIHDKHGRGTLFEVCETLIKSLPDERKPLAYVFENVKGIMSSMMTNGKTVPQEISDRMDHLGYNCSGPFLAKAEQYGVPQKRHRVLIIGLRKDTNRLFDYSDLSKYVIRESLEKGSLRHVISGVDGLPNSEEVWHLSPQAKYMSSMIKRSWKDIPYEKLPARFKRIRDNMARYRSPNFYRRFSWDEINGTITAAAQPENCGILHPEQDRRFSVREIARIQSFPDDLIFEAKNIVGKYNLIGNAVPPILGYVIGRALGDVIAEVVNGKIPDSSGSKMVDRKSREASEEPDSSTILPSFRTHSEGRQDALV